MNYLSNTVLVSISLILMVIKICLPAPVPPYSITNDINVVTTGPIMTKQRIYAYKDEMQEIIKFVDDFYTLVTKEPITESEINGTIQMIEDGIQPFKIREKVIVQYKVQNWSVRSSRPFDMYEYLFYLVPTIDQASFETLLSMQDKVQNGWLQFKTIVGLGDDVPMVLHNIWYNGKTQKVNVTSESKEMDDDKKPILWTTEKLTTVSPITTMMMNPTSEGGSKNNKTSTTSSSTLASSTISMDEKETTTPVNVPSTTVSTSKAPVEVETSTQRSNISITTIKSEKLISTTEKYSELETTTEDPTNNEISNDIEATTTTPFTTTTLLDREFLEKDSLTTTQLPDEDLSESTPIPESTTIIVNTSTSTDTVTVVETSTADYTDDQETTLPTVTTPSTTPDVTSDPSVSNSTVSRTDNNTSSYHNSLRQSKFLWTTEASNVNSVIEKPSFIIIATNNHIPTLLTKNKEQVTDKNIKVNVVSSYENEEKHHELNKEEGALNLRASSKNVTQQAVDLLFALTSVLNHLPV